MLRFLDRLTVNRGYVYGWTLVYVCARARTHVCVLQYMSVDILVIEW